MMENVMVQKIGAVPEDSGADESPSGSKSEQDIFASLLMLASIEITGDIAGGAETSTVQGTRIHGDNMGVIDENALMQSDGAAAGKSAPHQLDSGISCFLHIQEDQLDIKMHMREGTGLTSALRQSNDSVSGGTGQYSNPRKWVDTAQHALSRGVPPLFPEELEAGLELFQDIDNININNNEGEGWTAEAGIKPSGEKGPVNINSSSLPHSLQKYSGSEDILNQFSQRLINSLHMGTHSAKIRLHPAELGDLYMDISVVNKTVKAVITVESDGVKEIIEAGLDRLEADLKNQGLSIGKFTVDLKGGDPEGGFTSHKGRDRVAAGGHDGRGSTVNKGNRINEDTAVLMGNCRINLFV